MNDKAPITKAALRNPIYILLFAAMYVFAGCVLYPVMIHERENKGMAFFYGYIGFEDGLDVTLTEFILKKLDGEAGEYKCNIYRGVYFSYLPIGTYRIEKFTASDVNKVLKYPMPAQGNGFVIKKPTLYFLSSIRFRNQFFSNSLIFEPRIEKADWPTEEQVLERLLDVVEPGTSIEKALKKRMMQYRNLREKK